jgi:PTH1 family peptidyl-tRNA hydrolase
MKYILFGLGNIGAQYELTRHNVGFLFLDYLADAYGVSFKPDRFGMYATAKYRGRVIHMIKPDTFMNLSGNAVAFWLKKLNAPLNHVVVITDDLNLAFGTIRLKAKGSDGGHNGLKSIQQSLQQTNYPRVRFGISDVFDKGRQVDYVLGTWEKEEAERLPEMFEKTKLALEELFFRGIGMAMNKLNTVEKPKKNLPNKSED